MSEIDRGGARLAALGSQVSIEVLRPGFLTTVQDRGRFGYQKFGVPVSGALDAVALRVANILVGNPQGAAALEMTALGPHLRFMADAVVALSGAEIEAALDGEPTPWHRSFLVRTGQMLDVQACPRGLRGYLAIAGGIDVPIVLGSRSTCLVASFGGFQGRPLLAGDVLRVGPPSGSLQELAGREAPEDWRPRHGSPLAVRVVLGPQEDAFTEEGRRTFLASEYRVTPHADRMGYRLEGPVILHRSSADIISDWVPLGGVQVPGDGKPIILLADRQTTGGYAKIATVIGPDIGRVAQLRPGDTLSFGAVSVAEAQRVVHELEAALASLPARLVLAESWTYAARLGEVPGGIAPTGLAHPQEIASRAADASGHAGVRSPMAGLVARVLIRVGEGATAGQTLFVLQAMKMEFQVTAPRAGRIAEVRVREGDEVGMGDILATLDTSELSRRSNRRSAR